MSKVLTLNQSGSPIHLRLLLAPLLTAGVVILIVIIAIVPGVSAIFQGNKKAADLRSTRMMLAHKAESLQSLDPVSLEDQLRIGMSALPLTLPYQSTLSMLSTLLVNHGLGIIQLSFATEPLLKESILSIKMTVLGSYASLKNFLEATQLSLPLVAVRSLEITQLTNATAEPTADTLFSSDIVMVVYHRKPPASIGKPSDPLLTAEGEMQKTLRQLQGFEMFGNETSIASTSSLPVENLFPQ